HQEAVGQHHAHRMAVEARPQPALVLVPAQEPLGLLMVLLHPVPPVRVFDQALQGYIRPEVAPVVPALAIGGILADQPARSPSPPTPQPPPPPPAAPPRRRRAPTTSPPPAPAPPPPHAPERHDRAVWAPINSSPRRVTPPRRLKLTAKSARTATT